MKWIFTLVIPLIQNDGDLMELHPRATTMALHCLKGCKTLPKHCKQSVNFNRTKHLRPMDGGKSQSEEVHFRLGHQE